jgi:hypothetical protein
MLFAQVSLQSAQLLAAGLFHARRRCTLPPRPTLEADDLVTPAQAGELLGVPAGTVRQWILRNGIEPLGQLGRWPAYDYNEIAAVDARLRRKREARVAA